MKAASISIKRINGDKKRFEGEFYLNENSFLSMVIEDLSCCSPLSSKAEVFNPPVFKRQFCANTPKSVPYFQSSDVQNASEVGAVFIYGLQAKKLNLLVKEGDILVTGFGTIGNTRLVNRCQNGVSYANNVCRIRSNQGEYKGYIYAFLSSKYGRALLNKNASGSVVRYIEAPGIKKTLIPDFPLEFQEKVDGMIKESARLREEAADALEKAQTVAIRDLEKKNGIKINRGVNIKELSYSHNKRFEGAHYSGECFDHYADILSRPHHLLKDLTLRIFRPGIFKRQYVDDGVTFL